MNPKGNFAFHTGYLYVIGSGATPTPRRIATLQEVSFSFKGSNKELMGENMFAEAVGRSDIKTTGKAKTAKFSADAFNDIFFNQEAKDGHQAVAYDEEGTVASNTYTVTKGADFVQDLGVGYKLTGIQLKRAASAPAVGEYTVNESTGQYTFNAADDDKDMLFSYVYQDDTGGKTIDLVNMLAGEAPTFQGIFFNRFQKGSVFLKLNACVAENLDMGFKSGDFAMPDFGFMAQADASGKLGVYSQSNA